MPTLSAVQSSCGFASPHPLDQALQRELAAWAALDADHCSACRWLDEWSGPKAVKEPVARCLEALEAGDLIISAPQSCASAPPLRPAVEPRAPSARHGIDPQNQAGNPSSQ